MPGKHKENPNFGDDDDFDDEQVDVEVEDAGHNDEKGIAGHSTGSKFSDPTHDEISGYRQAEQLFKSSLLQLQIAELKGEINVDYSKLSSLEEVYCFYLNKWTQGSLGLLTTLCLQWLKTLKSYLEELPSSQVSRELLEETEEIPAGFEDLAFEPPSNFHMAGSYLLRSIVRPSLNVGGVSRIPNGIQLLRL
jgi:hypothetical protein